MRISLSSNIKFLAIKIRLYLGIDVGRAAIRVLSREDKLTKTIFCKSHSRNL